MNRFVGFWMALLAPSALLLASLLLVCNHTTAAKGSNGLPIPGCCLRTFQVDLKKERLQAKAMADARMIVFNDFKDQIYTSSISHHVFLHLASTRRQLHDTVLKFLWPKATILNDLAKSYPNSIFITDVFDELYIMRREFDHVDPEKKHYDGILKLPFITTVRSLTYLFGDPAELVAVSSQRRFQTMVGTAIVLDFNREYHYAICQSPQKQPRILIKAGLHVIPQNTPRLLQRIIIYSHRLVFFVIKTVRNGFERSGGRMERNILMAVDNAFRTLNKIHITLPLSVILGALYTLILAPVRHPHAFVPYMVYIGILCKRKIPPIWAWILFVAASLYSLYDYAKFSQWSMALCLVQHLGWVAVVKWVETNGDMARELLFAPIPDPIPLRFERNP